MMFLYLCLTLLPAAAMAVCDDDSGLLLFYFVDANDDDLDGIQESFGAFDLVDTNGDGLISFYELQKELAVLAPELTGAEEGILILLDVNKDRVVSKNEVLTVFNEIDENSDGVKTLDEYKRFLDIYCQRNQTEYAKTHRNAY